MKTVAKIACCIFFLFTDGMHLNAQTTYQFSLEYPVTKWTADAIEADDGSFIVIVSERSGVEYAPNDITLAYLLRISPEGDTLTKQYQFGDTLFNFTGITKTSSGGYLVTGFSELQENDELFLLLMEVDSLLNPIWVKHHLMNGYFTVGIRSIFRLNTGYILAGFLCSFPCAAYFPFFVRIENRGDIMHSNIYPDGSIFGYEYLMNKDTSQIWLFTGPGLAPINDNPSRAVFDTSFNHLYSELLYPSLICDFTAKWYSDTTFLLSFLGQRPGAPYQDDELFVTLMDTSLTILQQEHFGFQDTLDNPAYSYALDFKHRDSIYILGVKNKHIGYPGTYYKSWIMTGQLDEQFQARYLNFFGGDTYYETHYVKATRDGGSFICAGKWVPETQVYDLIFIKLNNEGILSGDYSPSVDFKQAFLYPNPVSDQLFVQTALKNATLFIYQIDGIMVLKYPLSQGVETIDLRNLLTGLYIYTIITPEGYHENGKFFKN